MPVLRIPTPLRSYTSGQSEVNVSGGKISEALTDLTNQYPTIKPHIFNEGGASSWPRRGGRRDRRRDRRSCAGGRRP